jgi:hypothetical protein
MLIRTMRKEVVFCKWPFVKTLSTCLVFDVYVMKRLDNDAIDSRHAPCSGGRGVLRCGAGHRT